MHSLRADFTLPGDLMAFPDGHEKHFDNGLTPSSRLLYQNSGGAGAVYFDVSAG